MRTGWPCLLVALCACSSSMEGGESPGGEPSAGGAAGDGAAIGVSASPTSGGHAGASGSGTGGAAGAKSGSAGALGGGDSATGGAANAKDGGGSAMEGGGGSLSDAGASDGSVSAPPPACDRLPGPGSWEKISPPGATDTQGLVLDPFDGVTMWLGTSPRAGGVTNGKGGLYKSKDCGATWEHVNTGANGTKLDTSSMWSLAVDPVEKGVVYLIGQYGPGGLWKSTNGGVDFNQLFPSTSEFAQIVEFNAVGSISMDPHDHLHLVVGTHGNCKAPYAPTCGAETKDGGTTWSFFTTPFLQSWAEQTGPYVLDATSWLFATIFDGLWLTTDRGASWKKLDPGLGVNGAAGGEYTVRPLLPGPDAVFYLPLAQQGGASGGLLRSTDGKSWSVVSKSPKGAYNLGFTRGDGKLYLSDRQGQTYWVASDVDPSTWTKLPLPAELATLSGQGGVFLDYDAIHHILYSSNFEGGAYRLVTK